MTRYATLRSAALATACGAAILTFALQRPARGEDAPPTPSAPKIAIPLPTAPPTGAVVLFSGKSGDMSANWYRRYSKEAPRWTVENGVASPRRHDLTSKQEFGDQYVHVEFRCPTEGGGNAGVGLMGRYEIQIFNDYGREPESHGAGALYSQTPARVNASKKAGEWQTYDIIFRAPRFDDGGNKTEEARATVFQNGILVQDNGQFKGPTGIQYGEYPKEAKTGPLVLQGDHDPVQYRNVWVVPL